MKKTFFLGLIIACCFLPSCEDDKKIAPKVPQFDIVLFEQNVRASINGLGAGNIPVGWAYAINQNGQLYAADGFGVARAQADAPLVPFTENTLINVASVSKFFTAVGVLQLLNRRNMTLNDLIEPWLPSNWTGGPGVSTLTFADLLTHRSGLQSTNTNFSQTLCYTCLQNVINTGVTGNKNQRNYLNVNFALFRILIPSLWRGLPGGPSANEELTDENTQTWYAQYMQERVFTPAGVSKATLTTDNTPTLYYNVKDPLNGTTGERYFDWTALAGGGGYYLSAIDIARVLAFYEHSETLLSNEMKTIMKNNRIGFDLPADELELHDSYYGKNGSISNGAAQGVLAQTLSFPTSNVEIVVVMNTQGMIFPDNNSLSEILHIAYNNAWAIPTP